MSVSVVINLGPTAASLITQYGAGAKLYLESAATAGGAYSAVSSTALVSGTERYTIVDAAGTPGTTWYRFAPGTSSAVDAAAYSDPWLSTSLTAYATLDDLREVVGEGDATAHDNLFTDLLTDVSADIDAMCGRRFYRSPQVTGTTTAYFDVVRAGMSLLSLATLGAGTTDGRALDIVSITNLYVRDSESGSYVEVTAGDTGYYLERGMGEGITGTDWPYEDISLSPAGTYTTWPTGKRAVKLVGVLGFPKVPAPVKRVCIAEAHERWRVEVGGGPVQVGVTAMGVPMFEKGRPISALRSGPWVKRSYGAL